MLPLVFALSSHHGLKRQVCSQPLESGKSVMAHKGNRLWLMAFSMHQITHDARSQPAPLGRYSSALRRWYEPPLAEIPPALWDVSQLLVQITAVLPLYGKLTTL